MKTFEQIWDKVAKSEGEGTRVMRYESQDDVVFLYASGFVDAQKYPLEEWLNAFNDSKTESGAYVVTYNQWMAKEKFYYTGPVREPFSALKIPEREFSEAEFVDMYKKCIVPSAQTTEKQIPDVLKDLTRRKLLRGGKLMMDATLKKEIDDFIIHYPSPLRVLEVNVQKLLGGEIATTGAGALDAMASGYRAGVTPVQKTQSELDSLLHGQKSKESKSKAKEEELSVKDLQQKVKNRPV